MAFVRAAAHDHTIFIESIFCEFLEGTQEVAAGHTGVDHLLFEARVSFGRVVIDFAGTEAVDEAAQLLEDTAEVTPDGRVVRSGRNPGIRLVIQLKKQMEPLQEDIRRGFQKLRPLDGNRAGTRRLLGYRNRARGVHASLSPMNGICLRCRYKVIREATNTMMARAKSNPLSPWTSIPSSVKWLKMAPAVAPAASSAPSQVNRGVRSKIDATSSITPEPMRPQGSAWTLVKM